MKCRVVLSNSACAVIEYGKQLIQIPPLEDATASEVEFELHEPKKNSKKEIAE